ncbi:unnamed protein product [Anisakis simplex]|uniref:Uncharacterized protein n=1 Tax=Anisakis simplex TaxID=6269 RepID=A0A3P6RCJ1_ANISI|nr:unnamed protein product [Anisakis simplex]
MCSSSTSSNSSSSPVSSRNDVYLSPTNPAHVESSTHTLNKQQLRTDANRLQRVPSSIFIQMY